MKKILGVLLFTLLITGCSGEKTTTVCKGAVSDKVATTVKINATDDKVTTMENIVTCDFSELISEETPITYYKDYMEEQNKNYTKLEGVKTKYAVNGNKVVLTVTVDYEKADFDELAKAKIIVSKDDKKVTYISLKETIDQQTKAGLTCKQK